jgi:glyoxylase-like metal-dependent hydrolase (beta-lactamase superfamily II)
MKRFVLGSLILVSLGVAAAFYWLFYENRLPTTGNFPLDITALRIEAGRLHGAGPMRIEVESIYRSQVPRIAMIGGTDWGTLRQVRNSYQLVFPDRTIILDTANDEPTARQDRWFTGYDEAAWQRMQRAMNQASTILVTHEHCDHIGGILQSPDWRKLLPKAALNDAQIRNVSDCTVQLSETVRRLKPIAYHGVRAIAPGVVLIRAPGHTPGSQMVYVRQSDGQEYIFMGDTASSLDNVRFLSPRSRYVMSSGTHGDDRRAVFLQTIALKHLKDSSPDITLVPGHDADAIDAIIKAGLLKRGFSNNF